MGNIDITARDAKIETEPSTEPPAGWRFRDGTHDREIWRCVVEEDEYRLKGKRFWPSDLIVDVGAHIGSFSWWAWQHGARNIEAYEACWENCLVCSSNLESLVGDVVNHGAIWGKGHDWKSNRKRCVGFSNSSSIPNTGGGDVITSRFGEHMVYLHHSFPNPQIRFLKLDCEYSEFPILLGNDLSKITEIAGEYHEIGPGTFLEDTKKIPKWAQIPGVPSWTRDVIRDRLEECGFDVEMNHEAENIGKFFAKNKERYAEIDR